MFEMLENLMTNIGNLNWSLSKMLLQINYLLSEKNFLKIEKIKK